MLEVSTENRAQFTLYDSPSGWKYIHALALSLVYVTRRSTRWWGEECQFINLGLSHYVQRFSFNNHLHLPTAHPAEIWMPWSSTTRTPRDENKGRIVNGRRVWLGTNVDGWCWTAGKRRRAADVQKMGGCRIHLMAAQQIQGTSAIRHDLWNDVTISQWYRFSSTTTSKPNDT